MEDALILTVRYPILLATIFPDPIIRWIIATDTPSSRAASFGVIQLLSMDRNGSTRAGMGGHFPDTGDCLFFAPGTDADSRMIGG